MKCKTKRELKSDGGEDKFQSSNKMKTGLTKVKHMNSLTRFIKGDELHKTLRYRKRAFSEIVRIDTVYHEMVTVE